MATSKLNIFNALPQHGESDEEDFQKTKPKKVGKTGWLFVNFCLYPLDDKSRNVKKTGTNAPSGVKEENARLKDTRKPKGVSEQPHPQDRHSGTGHSAYGYIQKSSLILIK